MNVDVERRLPPLILAKAIKMWSLDLSDLSLDTVKMFASDAAHAGFAPEQGDFLWREKLRQEQPAFFVEMRDLLWCQVHEVPPSRSSGAA